MVLTLQLKSFTLEEELCFCEFASYGARRFAASVTAWLDRAVAVVHSGLHSRLPPQHRKRGQKHTQNLISPKSSATCGISRSDVSHGWKSIRNGSDGLESTSLVEFLDCSGICTVLFELGFSSCRVGVVWGIRLR